MRGEGMTRRLPCWRDDAGAGTMVSLGIVAAIVTVTAALTLGTGAIFTLHAAQSVIDESALAAADSASGRSPGYPCDKAREIAGARSMVLGSCQISGHSARVTSTVILLGISIAVRAQTGPPENG
jgi:secretion/DNA translocation related TadE-like protein